MMYKKLYNLLDLDDTHLHITKKIITTTKKHHSSLLNSMQKRNINLQEIINQYAVEHNERVPKNKS